MRPDREYQDRLWEQGWAGHEQAQLMRMARLTLAEKLDWLEEAHTLVLQLERTRKQELDRVCGEVEHAAVEPLRAGLPPSS